MQSNFLKRDTFLQNIVPDIIKFTNITVLPLTTVYFECTTQYYTLISTMLSHTCTKVKVIHTLLSVQRSTILQLRSTVDYHLIEV